MRDSWARGPGLQILHVESSEDGGRPGCSPAPRRGEGGSFGLEGGGGEAAKVPDVDQRGLLGLGLPRHTSLCTGNTAGPRPSPQFDGGDGGLRKWNDSLLAAQRTGAPAVQTWCPGPHVGQPRACASLGAERSGQAGSWGPVQPLPGSGLQRPEAPRQDAGGCEAGTYLS